MSKHKTKGRGGRTSTEAFKIIVEKQIRKRFPELHVSAKVSGAVCFRGERWNKPWQWIGAGDTIRDGRRIDHEH
jgi:hypothetical protein